MDRATGGLTGPEVDDLLGRCVFPPAGTAVDCAVSGGPDSTALLVLAVAAGMDVTCWTVNHSLRPTSADETQLVARTAASLGVSTTIVDGPVDDGPDLEQRARDVRRAVLPDGVLTGHTADDQAETVLMRLLRGSGATGLGAMDRVRGGRYLRPLLEVWRGEIETYARARKLSYREDASNRDRRFLRNRVRRELLPVLRQYNANISAVLNRTARLLKDEDALLAELAQEALTAVVCERCSDKIVLDSKGLVDYHIAVQRRVVRAVLGGLSTAEGPFDFVVVERILRYIATGDERLRELGAGIRGQGGDNRYILRRGHRPEIACSLALPGVVELPGHGAEVHCEIGPAAHFDQIRGELGGAVAAFDADRLGKQVCLRSPRPGDRIQPLGMSGHKKLSDLFTDCKWPRILRDEVLVLACGAEIAWVAPLRSSHAFRVDAATVRMAVCRLRPAHREA